MTIAGTPNEALSLIAVGTQVVVRDEEWLVQQVTKTPADGLMVRCRGTSGFVRDTEATFLTGIDHVEPLRPEDTLFIPDNSPAFAGSRLYLEALLRATPVAASETGLAVAQHQLLRRLEYQRRATHKALTTLRPRLLIADAVGLGKTLEVGMILSELIRRGRGERILVVTPRHILEQFQHELWTRFAIPLVRLDSQRIERIRREIPASRNPFTHYKRAIVSIDTIKNAGRYRHHLEGIRWDAVVIDECHNLVNKGTLNNQLARTLAPRTEALLLTSATPHNGDPKSFAELVRLLDPTAIANPDDIKSSDIEHLYVRRHKHSDDVAAEVAGSWAERVEPMPLLVNASAEENALFAELADTWLHPASGESPVSGKARSLFPWTLFKAALSSHRALAETVDSRRKTLARNADDTTGLTPGQRTEDDALERLAAACEQITDESASKLARLIAELRTIGVGPKSKARVVVFSERIATLDWLAATVPQALGLKDDQIEVLHGGMADVKQMDVIERFGLADAKVRILFTGDMASEGVNLHRQCHHLVHFDLPWSLITIEQRNGRIDRFGQTESPEIRAMILEPDHPHLHGDVRVVTKLLEREHAAHKAFGDSASLLGLHAAELEEEAISQALREGTAPDDVVPEAPADAGFDWMTLMAGATVDLEVPESPAITLFESTTDFVDEALQVGFEDNYEELDLRRDNDDPEFWSLIPPRDLVNRFRSLPHEYLSEQKIAERLLLTSDHDQAEVHLERARESSKSSWPTVGFLSPLHPFIGWLGDRVLARIPRGNAPVLRAAVDRNWYAVQAQLSNGRGQPQVVEWLAVGRDTSGEWQTRPLMELLHEAGVGPSMPNPGIDPDYNTLEANIETAVDVARREIAARRAEHDRMLDERLAEPTERLEAWNRDALELATLMDERRRRERHREIGGVREDTRQLIESLRTTGDPLVRVVAAIVPEANR